jgi:transposase
MWHLAYRVKVSHMTKDAVIAVPGGPRRRTALEKLEIVKETLAFGASVSDIARRHGVRPNLVYLWRQQAQNGTLSIARENGTYFTPVALIERGNPSTAAAVIELVLCNGRVLRVPDAVTPSRVLQLAEVLERNER